jgi:serine/threonine protein kinase
MEFCEGGSVDKLMHQRGGKLAMSEAGSIILQVLEGLAYAHDKGFVHRDLKPQNIILAKRGNGWETKVGDFGLSKNFQGAGFSGMTLTGAYAGTFPFMPREQVTHFKYVKPVSDVWSTGAMFYSMLTGKFPRNFLPKQDPVEVILRGNIVPIRARNSGIPDRVAEVIDRALSNDVKVRYQNAAEMHTALAGVL